MQSSAYVRKAKHFIFSWPLLETKVPGKPGFFLSEHNVTPNKIEIMFFKKGSVNMR